MKRKLIQLSPSTKAVSLPSKWIRENKLQKGAELSLDIDENKVVISTESDKSKKELNLDVSTLEGKLVWVAVDAAYVAGYDSIILKTKDQEQTALMSKVVRYFPGMIIYEERKNKVHFKSMAESESDLDKILSRIFNMIIAMGEDSVEGLKAKDWNLLANMKRRDYVINSYVSLCLRHINKFGYKPFSKTGVMHTYLNIVEMLADKLAALFVAMGKMKKGNVKEVHLILDMLKHLQRMHFNYSQEKLVGLDRMRSKLEEEIKNTPLLPYFNEVVGLFFDIEELEMQLNV